MTNELITNIAVGYISLGVGLSSDVLREDWGNNNSVFETFLHWLLALLISVLLLPGAAIVDVVRNTANKIHAWLDRKVKPYRWLNDSIRYPFHLRNVNRMHKRGLQVFSENLKLDNWARRKLVERAKERIEEL